MRLALVFLPDELPIEQEPLSHITICEYADVIIVDAPEAAGSSQLPHYRVEKSPDSESVGRILVQPGTVAHHVQLEILAKCGLRKTASRYK